MDKTTSVKKYDKTRTDFNGGKRDVKDDAYIAGDDAWHISVNKVLCVTKYRLGKAALIKFC